MNVDIVLFVRNWKPLGKSSAQHSGGEQCWHLNNCLLANDWDSGSLENLMLFCVCWDTRYRRDARPCVLLFYWWCDPFHGKKSDPHWPWWREQHTFSFRFLKALIPISLIYEVNIRPHCLHSRTPTALKETWCWPTCRAIIVLMPLIMNIVG